MLKKIITVGIALSIIVLLISLFYSKNKGFKTVNYVPTATPTLTPAAVSYSGSFVDLFSGIGDSQVCTFSTDLNNGSSTKGVMYSGNGKMRGDFTAKVGTKVTESHIIVDDPYSYWWADGDKEGTQSYYGEEDLSLLEGNTSSSSASTETPAASDYSCNNWTVDDSIFDLPKNIKFSFSSKLQDQGQSQCSVCDEVKGIQRVECLKKLNCN